MSQKYILSKTDKCRSLPNVYTECPSLTYMYIRLSKTIKLVVNTDMEKNEAMFHHFNVIENNLSKTNNVLLLTKEISDKIKGII